MALAVAGSATPACRQAIADVAADATHSITAHAPLGDIVLPQPVEMAAAASRTTPQNLTKTTALVAETLPRQPRTENERPARQTFGARHVDYYIFGLRRLLI